MTAALVAALEGKTVILCEGTDQVGGTTATSAGTAWIPGNSLAASEAGDEATESARTYLSSIVSDQVGGLGLFDAFLASGREAIDDLAARTQVRFANAGVHPDYLEHPQAKAAGRALSPLPFDGRLLGKDFRRVRAPIPEFLVLRGMMANKTDVVALINRWRAPRYLFHSLKLIIRYLFDRVSYPRGTRLVMGNALVARLFYSLRKAGVQIEFDARLTRLAYSGGRITGAEFDSKGTTFTIDARLAVVLATGGIGHNRILRRGLLSESVNIHSLAFQGDRGEGITAALGVGASLSRCPGDFLWQPVSKTRRADGSEGLFPHLYLDRAKPGLIAVNLDGNRFVNEGASYHHFVEAMLLEKNRARCVPAFLICDADFIDAYGLGIVPPGTIHPEQYSTRCALEVAESLDQLASQIGIDRAGLQRSVERNNLFAITGVDLDFDKGGTAVSRFNGDASHLPNPCLAAIRRAPFYALAVWPADAASATGLATNSNAEVLGKGGSPICALYACGNDMVSCMQGTYPGPGATIGPALVFGWRIGKHIAASARSVASGEASVGGRNAEFC